MKRETITVNGQDFQVQAMPFQSYIQIIDRCTNKHGGLMKEPYMNELFKHCVIEPKISFSTFDDDFETGMTLVAEIESFLQSKKVQSKKENVEKE
jgi:hypothetical protein